MNQIEIRQQARDELAKHGSQIDSKLALVGLDGFVDKLMTVVDKRSGQGDQFTPVETIGDLGGRISAAAGKSTNIELYPKMEKLGGNGPIMANALLSGGLKTRYIGALGKPSIHPVFEQFAKDTDTITLADPGITHALEFRDGKIMLGTMASLAEVTYEAIIETMGEGAFQDLISRTDLLALVNWTMIPNMTSIFNALVDKVLSTQGPRDGRQFFFDLADPEKRTDADLRGALDAIRRFQSYGRVLLGLNLKEAQRLAVLFGGNGEDTSPDGLKQMASHIRREAEVGLVVIHPTDGAACADDTGSWYVSGPYCDDPLITTGAGDHFNAGFATSQVLGLSPQSSLAVAVCYSGLYVRSAKSPSLSDVDSFLASWQ